MLPASYRCEGARAFGYAVRAAGADPAEADPAQPVAAQHVVGEAQPDRDDAHMVGHRPSVVSSVKDA